MHGITRHAHAHCRFVGLLLATKLLPSGGDEAIRAVLKALSWPFISRLLAPLSATAQVMCVIGFHDYQLLLLCSRMVDWDVSWASPIVWRCRHLSSYHVLFKHQTTVFLAPNLALADLLPPFDLCCTGSQQR